MSEMDSMVSIYVLENGQLLEQLEELLLGGEKSGTFSKEQIDETFRVMHTVKGSSAMMEYNEVATLAHAVEDLFSKIRENAPPDSEWERIFDVVLESIDFFKDEIEKIQNGETPDGDPSELVEELHAMRARLEGDGEAAPAGGGEGSASDAAKDILPKLMAKLTPQPGERKCWAHVKFDDGCQMETIRADAARMSVNEFCSSVVTWPEDLEKNADEQIRKEGFYLAFTTTEQYEAMVRQALEETMLVTTVEMGSDDDVLVPPELEPEVIEEVAEAISAPPAPAPAPAAQAAKPQPAAQSSDPGKEKEKVVQSFINVNVTKIDKLMNLLGEIVTTESMVTSMEASLDRENFEKQGRQLRKLTDELQDIVMSIRMVPIAGTFHKMQRIVRDIAKKTHKKAELIIIGEDTEVDKNIIDSLSDPLMHIVRNAMDHGIETPEERVAAGKDPVGHVTLEANSTSGDIIVRVIDDGAGMDREKIIQKAYERGLTTKPSSEISDKEAFGFTLLPGFSTNEEVTEYSGRGVGMDVVHRNLETVGGNIAIDSKLGVGTTITMHIPLTLAILDGMKVTVGQSTYIIPTLSIRESLEPRLHKIITEPNGNEMIIIRGVCYPIVRLHRMFNVANAVEEFNDGIMVLVESEWGEVCLFADMLLGEQQAVVKPMPLYVTKTIGRIKGISGCSIMGNGAIALILDINSLLSEATA